MEVTTLVIAVLGAVTGVASLAWSIATHVLSGGRVNVKLLGGWIGPAALMTAPLERRPLRPDRQFVDTPILAVRVSNTGRLPISVEGWSVKIGKIGLSWLADNRNPPVPKLLAVGETATWFVPVEEVARAARAAREAKVNGSRASLAAEVTVGAGKARRSKSGVNADDLVTIFSR